MPREFFVLHSSVDPEPSGSKLRTALAAHAALERAQRLRDTVLYLLVAVSAPVWLAAVWPEWPWPGSRRFALTLWAVAAVALVLAVISERSWQRRCLRALTPQRPSRPAA